MRVTESMGPAWETMKRLLFRPFRAGTWFSFGFIFFLQSCMEGGGMGNGLRIPDMGGSGSGRGGHGGGDTADNLGGLFHQLGSAVGGPFEELFGAHGPDTGLIVIIAVAAVIIAVPVMVLAYWLGTRGQMMAIRSVASGQPDISTAWNLTREAGSALFKFQLAMAGIALAVLLPIAGVGTAVALPAIRSGEPLASLWPLFLGIGLVALLFMVPLALVGALARNFVAPIMLKHGVGAREGWRRFWAIGRNHVGAIFGFFVLRVLVGAVAGVAGVVASFLTCCLGFLPIVHQTLMAPYHVFERAWTLEVLASMSADFDLRGMGQPPPQAPFGGGGTPYNPYGGPPTGNPYAPPAFGGNNPYGGGGGGGYGGPPPAGGFGGA